MTPEVVPPLMASGMEWWNDGIVPVKSLKAGNHEASGFVNSVVTLTNKFTIIFHKNGKGVVP